MLVLTRKLSEEIRIGDDVVVKVLAINGNRVKLGIQAPPDVRIRRGELEPDDGPDGGETIIEIELSDDTTDSREAA